MTPSEINVAIAEECGWTRCYDNPSLPGQLLGWLNGRWDAIPDYHSDLNACVELCRQLAKEGWRCEINGGLDGTWECEFSHGRKGERHYGPGDELAHAITEAFLRAKGKWVEDQP